MARLTRRRRLLMPHLQLTALCASVPSSRCLAGKACAWGLVQASLLVWLRSVGRLVLVEVDGASVVVENFGVLPSNFSASHPRSSLVDTTCRPISPLHLPVTPLILYPLSRVHLSNAQNFASVNSTAYCLGLRLSSPASAERCPWIVVVDTLGWRTPFIVV